MVVRHRAGKKQHENANVLSRLQYTKSCPNYRLGVQPEDLPCGGCQKCTKAHEKWSHFAEQVDDVVSLSCCQVAVGSIFEEVKVDDDNPSDGLTEKENFIQ